MQRSMSGTLTSGGPGGGPSAFWPGSGFFGGIMARPSYGGVCVARQRQGAALRIEHDVGAEQHRARRRLVAERQAADDRQSERRQGLGDDALGGPGGAALRLL